MRVLLDECLPRKLKLELPGLECRTVLEMGWAGLKNGALLAAAAGQFDVFLTSDQNLAFQQNISALTLAMIALVAPSNDIDDLRPRMPLVLDALPTLRPGHLIQVGA